MVESKVRRNIADVLLIFADILNLAEQIGVYFISKQDDLDESSQQRFFFVLFGVGIASACKPMFIHPIAITLFSIAIEIGELVAYLTLLKNTTSLLVVTILFFILGVILNLLSIYGLWDRNEDYCENIRKKCCTIPIRVIIYAGLYEIQILFLFLDPESPFRGTFYEVLMIIGAFCGLSMIERSVLKICPPSDDDDNTIIYYLWQTIIGMMNTLVLLISMITAMVYAGQQVQNRDQLKTYDFVIYVIILVLYGLILGTSAIALLCACCLCAGAIIGAICSAFK